MFKEYYKGPVIDTRYLKTAALRLYSVWGVVNAALFSLRDASGGETTQCGLSEDQLAGIEMCAKAYLGDGTGGNTSCAYNLIWHTT